MTASRLIVARGAIGPQGPSHYQIVTSGTRPPSPIEGDLIYETDTDCFQVYDGAAWVQYGPNSAWTAFTPTLTAGVTITKTIGYSRWMRMGRLIIAQCELNITGVGTASNLISVGLPVAAAVATGMSVVGSFGYLDAGTAYYTGAAVLNSATAVSGLETARGAYIGAQPAFTTASGDAVAYGVMYEAAA